MPPRRRHPSQPAPAKAAQPASGASSRPCGLESALLALGVVAATMPLAASAAHKPLDKPVVQTPGAAEPSLQSRVLAVRAAMATLDEAAQGGADFGSGALPPALHLMAQANNWTNWPKWSKWSNWANK